jgi:hypothetical protein
LVWNNHRDGQVFKLEGSTTAGGSGMTVAGGECLTGGNQGDTCIVEIWDGAGNSDVCESPVNMVDVLTPWIEGSGAWLGDDSEGEGETGDEGEDEPVPEWQHTRPSTLIDYGDTLPETEDETQLSSDVARAAYWWGVRADAGTSSWSGESGTGGEGGGDETKDGTAWSTLGTDCSGSEELNISGTELAAPAEPGQHTLYLCVRDHADNVGSWAGEFNWDDGAPDLQFETVLDEVNNSTQAKITAGDEVSGLRSIYYRWGSNVGVNAESCSVVGEGEDEDEGGDENKEEDEGDGGMSSSEEGDEDSPAVGELTALTDFTVGTREEWTSDNLVPPKYEKNTLYACVIDVAGNITAGSQTYLFGAIDLSVTVGAGEGTSGKLSLRGMPGEFLQDYLTAKVITDNPTGYHLDIEAKDSPDLLCDLNADQARITALDATATTMLDNHWGYHVSPNPLATPSASSSWTGVTASPATFKTYPTATHYTLGDQTVVWFATRLSFSLPACAYRTTVTITAIAN